VRELHRSWRAVIIHYPFDLLTCKATPALLIAERESVSSIRACGSLTYCCLTLVLM
jgi:hypothetical protein